MWADIIDGLLSSPEPSIRWKVRTKVLGEQPNPALLDEIRGSDRVRRLLVDPDPSTYAKWRGPHWILAALADLGYPAGDPALHQLRDQVLGTWLEPGFYAEFEAGGAAASYGKKGVPVVAGRHRSHASQQGNALRSLVMLGLADERCEALAERLAHWQWPDGGWNCDRRPAADTSSFCETLLPMRGLFAYGETAAARRAAEVFLSRRLVFRRSDGALIHPEFAKLHHPLYWHYDVLGGLTAMAELGLIRDTRCADALDLLESLQVAGGWPAHARYYKPGTDVDWGGTSSRRANPWVTAEALAVLHAAGRL